MDKVYILTAGAYSDYHIIAVFASKEDAEKVVEADHLVTADIEEWELNSTAPKMPLWSVDIYKTDGTVEHVACRGLIGASYQVVFKARDYIDIRWCIRVDTRATDMQHAIKIAHEQWAQRKANGEFDE